MEFQVSIGIGSQPVVTVVDDLGEVSGAGVSLESVCVERSTGVL
jgi:hypothetical protein